MYPIYRVTPSAKAGPRAPSLAPSLCWACCQMQLHEAQLSLEGSFQNFPQLPFTFKIKSRLGPGIRSLPFRVTKNFSCSMTPHRHSPLRWGLLFALIFQMRKLRHKEFMKLAQDTTGRMWSWDLNSGLLAPKPAHVATQGPVRSGRPTLRYCHCIFSCTHLSGQLAPTTVDYFCASRPLLLLFPLPGIPFSHVAPHPTLTHLSGPMPSSPGSLSASPNSPTPDPSELTCLSAGSEPHSLLSRSQHPASWPWAPPSLLSALHLTPLYHAQSGCY